MKDKFKPFIGESVKLAEKFYANSNKKLRIIKEHSITSLEYRKNRINIVVDKDNIIIDMYEG